MKYLLYILLLAVPIITHSQTDSSLHLFIRSLERNIVVRPLSACDSCYVSNTLLKIDIDNNYKVKSITISDNADNWLFEQLSRMQSNNWLNISKLEEFSKRQGIKNASILLPMSMRTTYGGCNTGNTLYGLDDRYYQFHGKLFSGNCVFLELLEWEIPEPTH